MLLVLGSCPPKCPSLGTTVPGIAVAFEIASLVRSWAKPRWASFHWDSALSTTLSVPWLIRPCPVSDGRTIEPLSISSGSLDISPHSGPPHITQCISDHQRLSIKRYIITARAIQHLSFVVVLTSYLCRH